MKKRLLLSGLVLILLVSANPIAKAIDSGPDTPPRVVTIYIDGQPTEHITSVILNSTTYVSIPEFSAAMGADSATAANGTAVVAAPALTVQATAGLIYLEANGRYLYMPNSCILMNDHVMAPIRVLSKAFDAAGIVWDGATYSIFITKGSGAIKPASEFYDETDLYWMSRIIQAEAGGESLIGKIAVGGVIMNRIKSPEFPDTVYNVVFDRRYGVQFTPAYSGAIYNKPSEECVIAAKIALDGGNTAGDSLYFASTTHCWAGRNRPYTMKIGNHNFYA